MKSYFALLFYFSSNFLCCVEFINANDLLLDIEKAKPESIKFRPSPKSYITVEEYVAGRGYAIERHLIDTEDGYRLMYHHISRSPKFRSTTEFKKIPVFLQHGFLSCSGTFMAHKNSLAFLLADAGFDVWLGNARGNVYSRKHNKMDPDTDDKFWEFSFHEMGKYDLPAGIDYILKNTGFSKLYYIGYSMGTTMYFVMGSTRPEYMDKIEAMIGLAPVVRPKNMGIVKHRIMFFLIRWLFKILAYFGYDEMFPHSQRRIHYTEILCNPHGKQMNKFCSKLLWFLHTPHSDPELQLRSFLYFPAGASVRTQEHFFQMAEAGRFQHYDFGKKVNMKRYRESPIPPQYDLMKVTSPVYLVWGEKDSLSVKEDVEWLLHQFPTEPFVIKAQCIDFTHEDFMYGKNVAELLHYHIIKQLYDHHSKNGINNNIS